MSCVELSILEEQYKRTEQKVSSDQKELTSEFSVWNVCKLSVHGNHLSSVQMVTDVNASVVQFIQYAPFGEVIGEDNTYWHQNKIPDFKFNGKELDEESGMYYFEARYHKPPMFISRDPLFEEKHWMNPYAYCSNSPVNRVDPTGMLDGDYYSAETGKWLYNDGIDDNKIYEVTPASMVPVDPSNPNMVAQDLVTHVGDVVDVKMSFTGQSNENKPKLAEGQLDVIQVGSNGKEYTRMSLEVASGQYGNGSLPNGDYEAYYPRTSSTKGYVVDGVGFAISLNPKFATNRDGLEIHPDQSPRGTMGCIGLQSPKQDLQNFYDFFKSAYKTFGKIGVNVNVNNNAGLIWK